MSCVLVVGDDPDLREAAALTLQHAGYRVRQAADEAEALDLARAHRPAAVLLDQMPGLDGRGFLEAWRAEPGHSGVPVVVMAGRHAAATALAGLFPAIDVLRKPFRATELRAAVARAVSTTPGSGAVATGRHDQTAFVPVISAKSKSTVGCTARSGQTGRSGTANDRCGQARGVKPRTRA